MRALALLALLTPGAALAQDIETRTVDVEATDNPVDFSLTFDSEWHEVNNLDFRPLDETSDQSILDSDDRFGFAYTSLAADVVYRPDPQLTFTLGASHRGLWGNDQLGGTDAYGGWAYFYALHLQYQPVLDAERTRLLVGREFYNIGGLGGSPDYALADVLDHVRFDLGLGGVATLTLFPVDVVGLMVAEDDLTMLNYTSQGETSPYPMRGDRMSTRHGAVFTLDGIDSVPLVAKAYAFYTDIGAAGSGSDISYGGTLGNFTDNDWVANFGVRAQVTAGPVTPFAGLDLSSGVDRKELVANDVDCNGSAITAGAALDTGDDEGGVHVLASFYRALGAAYGEDGLMYSHGYVSMKGLHTGGHIVSRMLGWHPSAYMGRYGIHDNPHDKDRAGGTQVLHAEASFEAPFGLGGGVAWWHMVDTGVTFVDLNNIELIEPPFGYSRDLFAAEGRLGQALGQEIDVDLSYRLHPMLKVYATGAMLMPGPFYAVLVERIAGTQLGGEATTYAAMGGLEASF